MEVVNEVCLVLQVLHTMNIVIVRILRVVYNVFMLYFFVNGK